MRADDGWFHRAISVMCPKIAQKRRGNSDHRNVVERFGRTMNVFAFFNERHLVGQGALLQVSVHVLDLLDLLIQGVDASFLIFSDECLHLLQPCFVQLEIALSQVPNFFQIGVVGDLRQQQVGWIDELTWIPLLLATTFSVRRFRGPVSFCVGFGCHWFRISLGFLFELEVRPNLYIAHFSSSSVSATGSAGVLSRLFSPKNTSSV